jgi:hypothetical protein
LNVGNIHHKKKGEIYENKHGVVDRSSQGGDCGSFGQGREIKRYRIKAEKQPGRFDGVRSTTPYESQKVQADGRQDIKFADQLNIYYDEVISVLRDAESILLFGPGEAKGELKKRLEDDRLAHLIQAVETVDQMTDGQIAAKVREYFN